MGGMEKKYLHDGIWYIENYANPSDIDKILGELKNNSNWSIANKELIEGSNFYNNTTDLNKSSVGDIIRSIYLDIGTLFPDSEFRASLISRYPATSTPHFGNSDSNTWAMNPHVDNDPIVSADVTHGVILYFNDDYKGGEISYPELGIDFSPKSNTLLCHDASILHGVKPVIEGTRYIYPGFVHRIKK